MKIINLQHRGGKTFELVKEFEKDPFGVLVVFSPDRKYWIMERYEVAENKVFTVEEVLKGKARNSLPGLGLEKEPNFYIDDVDIILQGIFKYGEIKFITFNKED